MCQRPGPLDRRPSAAVYEARMRVRVLIPTSCTIPRETRYKVPIEYMGVAWPIEYTVRSSVRPGSIWSPTCQCTTGQGYLSEREPSEELAKALTRI